jgi:dienelactone hydrolase
MKFISAFLFILALSALLPLAPSHAVETPADLIGQTVEYTDGETTLEGYYVPSRCGDLKESYPTVMVIHQWKGLTDNEKMRAEMLARQCYNAFAIDMYGKGVRPDMNEAAQAESSKYKNSPELALSRMDAAMDYLRVRPHVDMDNLAAIGYCFGGGMVLELARSGAELNAVGSFHGSLASAITDYKAEDVKAAIAVYHGMDDPLVPAEDVQAFKDEMEANELTYNFTAYDNAVHAFTQIEAGTDNSTGVAYNLEADRESWAALLTFLTEQLGGRNTPEEEMEIEGNN